MPELVERERRTMLVLEGVPELPEPDGWRIVRGGGPLTVARLLGEERPGAIVLRAEKQWQRAWVRSIPPERRPAVLVQGETPGAATDLADDWFGGVPSLEEMTTRLYLALGRARGRAQLSRRVLVDTLTGLPNRRAVMGCLIREARKARRGGALSVVLLDLDGFKQVNERGGHPAGDRLLRRVGAALRRVTRDGELCGRVGGDEFAMVISGGPEAAERAVDRVRQELRQIGVEASCARATLRPGEQLRELYRRTDGRLRAAKDEGRQLRANLYSDMHRPRAASRENHQEAHHRKPPRDTYSENQR